MSFTARIANPNAALSGLERKLSSPALLQEIGAIAVEDLRLGVLNETSPDGTPYKPLSPRYKAIKRGPGILRETGKMWRSWSVTMQGSRVIVANTDPKALKHQKGEGRLPARPFIGISKRLPKKVKGKILEHLRKR